MAFCSRCKSAMGTTEANCPSCGYDFSEEGDGPSVPRRAIAHSPTATVALVVGTFGAGLAATWSAIVGVTSAYHGHLQACAAALLLSMILVGVLGVFVRVSNL